MQIEADLRKSLAKFANNIGQHIACLRVRCRNRERTLFLLEVLGSNAANVFDFLHDKARACDHLIAGGRNAVQTFAFPCEQLQSELLFEQFQLFANAGL